MDVSFCLYVFMSLVTGAVLSFLINHIFNRKIDYLLSLCAGIIGGVLILEFIPHSFSAYRPIPLGIGIIVGFLFIMIIDRYIHHSSKEGSKSTFYLFLIAITLHNAPSGVALGNNVDHAEHLYHLVVLHHLPEGMVLMMLALALKLKPYYLVAAFSYLTLSLYWFILIGKQLMITNDWLLGALLGVAISTMLYIAIVELFFTSFKKGIQFYHWLSLLIGIFIVELLLMIG